MVLVKMEETKYVVRIANWSKVRQNYFLFSAPPIVSGIASEVYTNAWINFPSTPDRGQAIFSYTEELFGYWGVLSETIAPGTIVEHLQALPVTPENSAAPGTKLVFVAKPAQFDQTKTTRDVRNGAFAIESGDDFLNGTTRLVFGMGKTDNYGLVSPVATFAAEPSTTSNIIPVVKFFVSTGKYTAGSIIDLQEVGTTAEIDFTGRSDNTAVVKQLANGTYTVAYYNS